MADLDTIKKGLLRPWKVPPYLLKRYRRRRRLRQADGWEEFYILTTKNADDPRALVGPKEVFEEHREWQFDLITGHGLEPHHTVLELGCGVLRAGIPIIEYLDAGNYAGMDISLKALSYGHKAVHEHDLETKRPMLIQNEDLKFEEVADLDADYMLSNSVWTHLPPDRLETCIDCMGRALAADAVVLTTVELVDGDDPVDQGQGAREGVDWGYPRSWLAERLDAAGYDLTVLDVDHPTDQDVLRIDRRPEAVASD